MALLPTCLVIATTAVAKPTDAKPPPTEYTLHSGLHYSDADPKLTLDLYLPREVPKPAPCVVVIQGGGFVGQDGKRFRPYAEYLADHGIAAALIAYRGRPNHTYRDTMADVKAAVRYVRKNAKAHNMDPSRIGAMGKSAGGTLTALLDVTGDVKDIEANGGDHEISSRIQAAVAFAGVFDFVSRFTNPRQIALQPKLDKKKKTNGEWIGEPFSPSSKAWQAASAVNYIDKGDAPILLLHCKDDATVPWLQTEEMALRLRKTGVPVEVEYFATGGHGFKTKDRNAPMARMVAFFRKTLAKQSTVHPQSEGVPAN